MEEELKLEQEPEAVDIKKETKLSLKYIKDIEEHFDELISDIDSEIADTAEDVTFQMGLWDKECEDVRFRQDDSVILSDKIFNLYLRQVKFYRKVIEHYMTLLNRIKLKVKDKYILKEDFDKELKDIRDDVNKMDREITRGGKVDLKEIKSRIEAAKKDVA